MIGINPIGGVPSIVLIPLGTDRPNERKPVVTHTLIAINIGVFVAMAVLGAAEPDLANRVTGWGAVGRRDFGFWQPITSAFFHAGFMHIFGNMIFLLVFGPPVEDRFGRVGFTVFYLAGAIASALAHIGVEQAPAIGASGAVAAVSGAFLVLFPKTHIKCFVFFLVIGVFMIPSWWLIGLYIVLDLFAQVFSPANGIANIAHLGGYGFGMGIALFLLVTHILPREPYDLFSILRQRHRKRAFAAAGKDRQAQIARVRTDRPQPAHRQDPVSDEIAEARSAIGSLIAREELDKAADQYLAMLDKYKDKVQAQDGAHARPLTMHRDAQYQIANTLYQRGDRIPAANAFSRLLDTYPADPERHIIAVLIARTRAQDQDDPVGAIELLEELSDRAHDDDTRALIDAELETIRAMTGAEAEDTDQ